MIVEACCIISGGARPRALPCKEKEATSEADLKQTFITALTSLIKALCMLDIVDTELGWSRPLAVEAAGWLGNCDRTHQADRIRGFSQAMKR